MKIKFFILDIVLAIGLFLQVIYFYQNLELLAVILILYNFLILYFYKSKSLVLIFVFSGVFGSISEIVAISHGVWSYSTPQFYGIPYWLPLVWGHAGVFLYRVGDGFKKKVSNRLDN